MDATKTLNKKSSVFGFYPDTEEDVEVMATMTTRRCPRTCPVLPLSSTFARPFPRAFHLLPESLR